MQRRETQFDSILKRGLDAQRESGTAGCADEAALAAYCDHTMSDAQAARWEEHFSNCARCQEILAAMARARAAQEPQPARAPLKRWQLYGALAAAAVGISIAVSLMRSGGHHLELAQSVSQKEALSAALRDQLQSRTKEAGSQIALNERSNRPALQAPRSAVAQAPPLPGAREIAPQPKELAKQRLSQRGELDVESKAKSLRTGSKQRRQDYFGLGAPAGPAPAPAPPAQAPESAPMAAAGARTNAEIATAGASMGGFAAARNALVGVRTADNMERWRLGADGTIEHREAKGSWQRQDSGVSTVLRAGSAPSPTTCWIVGGDGTILRTVDGEHWKKINSPTSADLVAVFAVDASAATVTAADGRRFATSDGGQAWHQL